MAGGGRSAHAIQCSGRAAPEAAPEAPLATSMSAAELSVADLAAEAAVPRDTGRELPRDTGRGETGSTGWSGASLRAASSRGELTGRGPLRSPLRLLRPPLLKLWWSVCDRDEGDESVEGVEDQSV